MVDNNRSDWRRWGALFLLAIAVFAWPSTWLTAYAQSVGSFQASIPTPTPELEPSVGWIIAQADTSFPGVDDSEAAAINRRAARFLDPKIDPSPVRSPNLTPDPSPVRSPNTTTVPSIEASAPERAARLPQFSDTDILDAAQRGQDLGLDALGAPAVSNIFVDESRAEPGVNQTGAARFNVNEMMPGHSASAVQELDAIGSDLYHHPEDLKDRALANNARMSGYGCRRTNLKLVDSQDVSRANTGPQNRVLMVEFFDIIHTPIPGSDPVRYEESAVPGTYSVGTVDLAVPTLGGSGSVHWDIVDENHAIKYTHTPYSAPRGRNYFTYNTRLAVDSGGGLAAVSSAVFSSYGSADTGWTPTTSYAVPQGATAVYLAADLYQTDVAYSQPTTSTACDPDPPASCTVSSVGGGTVNWCPGTPGAGVAAMYDDRANPSEAVLGLSVATEAAGNDASLRLTHDPDIQAGLITWRRADGTPLAKELVELCTRAPVGQTPIDAGRTYHVEDIQACTEALINPYPNGCDRIARNFGISRLGDHTFLTVRAFNKVKVPVLNPITGEQAVDQQGRPLYTYSKQPANVIGPIDTNYPVMGGSACTPRAPCSTEPLPDDPLGSSEGYYLEYEHTPFSGAGDTNVVNQVRVLSGGTGSFTYYGRPSDNWQPVGNAAGDGTLHQMRLVADIYAVTINRFTGCEDYMNYAADNICTGAKLVCTDSAPTRTVGGVTFGPNTANGGIVDVLKKWGTDASAVYLNRDIGADEAADEGRPNGPPIHMLDDPMCWAARGTSFTYCASVDNQPGGTSLSRFFKSNGSLWATDCAATTDIDGHPLNSSPSCARAPNHDECDAGFSGLFTGTCYVSSVAYDCGDDKTSSVPLIVGEQADVCSGIMRCTGTTCHRPNLAGNHGDSFVQAITTMESVNAMAADAVCSETGLPPTDPNAACTLTIFNGESAYCKKPIGHQIGITPNCCNEAKKGVSSGPTWMQYMTAAMALSKIARNETFQNLLTSSDVYNHTAHFFGEIARPFTDMWQSASSWVTEQVIKPFSAGFDNLFGSFFNTGGSTAAEIGTSSALKLDSLGDVIAGFKTQLMNGVYEVINSISPEVANAIFVNGGTTSVALTPAVQNLLQVFNTVMLVYSIASLIGHIVFACKQAEFEWAMNDRWRLCTFVKTCCGKKVAFIGCVERRQIYCCYKSIAMRVIAEQITQKNLTGSRPNGFLQSTTSAVPLNKCRVNCNGYTPMELATVDWSQVDLTEWTDALVEGGMFNPPDPRSDFGVTPDGVDLSQVLARQPSGSDYDTRSAAAKTAEGLAGSMDQLSTFSETLRDSGVPHCYEDGRKMPFTYPGCRTTP